MEKFSKIEACPVNFWHFDIYSKKSLEVVVKLYRFFERYSSNINKVKLRHVLFVCCNGNVNHTYYFLLLVRFKRTFFKTLMQEIQEVETEHVSWTSWSMRKRLLRSLDSRWSDRGDGIKRLFVLPLSILCHSPLSKRLFLFKLTSFVYYVHFSPGSVRFLSTFFIFTSYFPWAAPLKFSFCVDPHKRGSSFFVIS